MRKFCLFFAVLFLTVFCGCQASEIQGVSTDSQTTQTIEDEAVKILSGKGFKKKTYIPVIVDDEAEKALVNVNFKKVRKKDIVYTDNTVFPSDAPYMKRVVYTGAIPTVSGVPVKISSKESLASMLKIKKDGGSFVKIVLPLLGSKVRFEVAEDVIVNNKVLISKGTPVYGYVTFNMPPYNYFQGILEVSNFYFIKDGIKEKLYGTISNVGYSSPERVLVNEQVSLQSFGTKTKMPAFGIGAPQYITKNIPYTVYYDYN